MKAYSSRQSGEAFTMLRASLSRLNLTPELVDNLIERHIAISFEKGALAFCEGNTDGMLACIVSGFVNIYCPIGDRNRTLVRIAGPGEIIGYPDYLDEKGRNARMFEAQVATKCTLALFSREHLAQLLAGLPIDQLIAILAALNTFWSENLWFFTTLLSLPLSDRLTIVMSDLAKRAGVRDSEGIVLIPEIIHDDLAEMIGCSRPMISKLIAQMVEAKLLARRGRQYVLLNKWNYDTNKRPSARIPNSRSRFVDWNEPVGHGRRIIDGPARSHPPVPAVAGLRFGDRRSAGALAQKRSPR
jgi:CRP/FNR family transcriptional regulator, cyclic AMP receptor protein